MLNYYGYYQSPPNPFIHSPFKQQQQPQQIIYNNYIKPNQQQNLFHKQTTRNNEQPTVTLPSKVTSLNTGKIYQICERLQNAVYGGVYRGIESISNEEVAIKIQVKIDMARIDRIDPQHFIYCESPYNDHLFREVLKGNDHVLQVYDDFEDDNFFYVISPLARGGDLLEAVRVKKVGYSEEICAEILRQVLIGADWLHREKHLALRDLSLENMLLFVNGDTGEYQVKLCDPGQAICFEVDINGLEIPVPFSGHIGKSFRPPEIYNGTPYIASKVDAWCLGWATFNLLTAQMPFKSADPRLNDLDYRQFCTYRNTWGRLLNHKGIYLSPVVIDFLLKLLDPNPIDRMSLSDALNHPLITREIKKSEHADLFLTYKMEGLVKDNEDVLSLSRSQIFYAPTNLILAENSQRTKDRTEPTSLVNDLCHPPAQHAANSSNEITFKNIKIAKEFAKSTASLLDIIDNENDRLDSPKKPKISEANEMSESKTTTPSDNVASNKSCETIYPSDVFYSQSNDTLILKEEKTSISSNISPYILGLNETVDEIKKEAPKGAMSTIPPHRNQYYTQGRSSNMVPRQPLRLILGQTDPHNLSRQTPHLSRPILLPKQSARPLPSYRPQTSSYAANRIPLYNPPAQKMPQFCLGLTNKSPNVIYPGQLTTRQSYQRLPESSNITGFQNNTLSSTFSTVCHNGIYTTPVARRFF